MIQTCTSIASATNQPYKENTAKGLVYTMAIIILS